MVSEQPALLNTICVTVYVPPAENVCVPFCVVEIFEAPEAGSPKFHSYPVMVLGAVMELISVNTPASITQMLGTVKSAVGFALTMTVRVKGVEFVHPLSVVTFKVTV